MIKHLLLTLILLSLLGCQSTLSPPPSHGQASINSTNNIYYANETPMEAKIAWQGTDGAKALLAAFNDCDLASAASPKTVGGKAFTNPTKCHLSLLSNSDSETYVRRLSGQSTGQILTSNLSVEGESYEVTMLWSKHTWMNSPEEDEDDIARYQIGVGAKIVANIYNISSGVDLADITGLAIAAEANNLTGSITFKRIGINGKLSEIILPSFSESLDKDAVINAIQSMQKIQLLLHSDEDVTIKPSVLGYMLPKQDEVPAQGLGWLYIGHYPDDKVQLTAQFGLQPDNSHPQVNGLVGQKVTTTTAKNIRADKPRFPIYTLAPIVTSVPSGCELKIEKLDRLGINKYWAYVSKVKDCG
ncbi:hypothetical protein [Shewanella sp. NIFS-20-20]|uniref:hypothetical protein n=1 Tax=Shewanella sp. NIFS-20-20 TaxID=2853806 RepID=UPI001C44736D|nr:hypothetical protein [Shewanella sp. NIFS-20-20]MBV7316002.1 hypothetical protein [Shewanella sp. NIFS-20-20]